MIRQEDRPKPKLLYVITQGAWGGAQKYVFDLATSLADDFDVTVAIGEPDGVQDLQSRITLRQAQGRQYHVSRIKIMQLKHVVRRISPLHDFLAIFELRQLYKKIKPDIVHLNSSKASIIGSLASWYVVRGTWYVAAACYVVLALFDHYLFSSYVGLLMTAVYWGVLLRPSGKLLHR